MDKWDRILSEDNVLVDLKSRRKFDVLRELSAVFVDDDAIEDPKQFLADLIRREQESSSGIGKGVAVPHVHEDSISRQILAIGVSREGIDFVSVDEAPVHVVAMLGTPRKHQKQHMELLAELSRLLQQGRVRDEIVEAADAGQVLAIFKSGS
jgi:fructose-specific phosphotransferase system IIA component